MTEEEIKNNLGKGFDLRGQIFGKLRPIYPLKEREKGGIIWHCKCECGNECDVNNGHLKDGSTKSCGCLRKETQHLKIKDLSNQKFGEWTVLYQAKSKNNHSYWHCRCSCGKEKDVASNSLQSGKSLSCGCSRRLDISNQRFGKLIAIEPIEIKNRTFFWLCKCDCGTKIIVPISSLRGGHTTSCGCLKSKGEFIIAKILTDNGIPYEKEKIFNTCKFEDTNGLARFDFFINNSYLVEYDGNVHYISKGGWNTNENLLKVIQHDKYKTQWCKDNNIPLIRIPYTHLDNLCLEDLQLETSKFIVTNK